MNKLIAVSIILLALVAGLAACAPDPCQFSPDTPSCDTARAVSRATMSAVQAQIESDSRSANAVATRQALETEAQAQKSRIALRATEQVVSARATEIKIQLDTTKVAAEAIATRTRLDTESDIERSAANAAAAPMREGLYTTLSILLVAGAAVALLVYSRRSLGGLAAFAARASHKRTAPLRYGANNEHLALVVYDKDNRPSTIFTTENMIDVRANLTGDPTTASYWQTLNVTDEMKLALIADANKRKISARIAASTGTAPWKGRDGGGWSVQPAAPPAALPQLPASNPEQGIIKMKDILTTWKPSQDEMLLGIDAAGKAQHAHINQLLSTIVIGRAENGKTSLLRELALQCLMIGVRVVAWDLHDDIASNISGLECHTTPEEIRTSAEEVRTIIEQRRSTGQKNVGQYIMVLVDEYNGLADIVPEAGQVIELIVTQARKYRVFATVTIKYVAASDFVRIGVVKSFSSRISFATSPDVANRAGFDPSSTEAVRTLTRGEILFEHGAAAQVLRVPYISFEEMNEVLATSPSTKSHFPPLPATSREAAREAEWQVVGSGSGSGHGSGSRSGAVLLSDPKTQQALDMLGQGISQRTIIKEIWGTDSGHSYQAASRELSEMIRQFVTSVNQNQEPAP